MEKTSIIRMLKDLASKLTGKKARKKSTTKPIIVPRAEHSVSRNDISPNALKVLYRLNKAGFSAYLVGGCVRDILMGKKPKDFDVATNAHPEQIRKVFSNCRLIGRRFRLAHIFFGREIIEVATFRTHHENGKDQQGKMQKGMIIRDNVYGTIEDDAWRRDFRINALYYNIADFSIVDYTGGMRDIKNQVIHMIGDPEQRYHEDPVRLLRAVRFLAKLPVSLSPKTEAPIVKLSYLLGHVSSARLYQEVLKFFQEGSSFETFELLQKHHLLKELFPLTNDCLANKDFAELVNIALKDTDRRIKENKGISKSFMFAILMWQPYQNELKKFENSDMPPFIRNDKAIQNVLKSQTQILTIPRMQQVTIREIYLLQHRLLKRTGKSAIRLLAHPRFRAGYDLLVLRSKIDPSLEELAKWWTDFQEVNPEAQAKMTDGLNKGRPKRKGRRYRKPNKDS